MQIKMFVFQETNAVLCYLSITFSFRFNVFQKSLKIKNDSKLLNVFFLLLKK